MRSERAESATEAIISVEQRLMMRVAQGELEAKDRLFIQYRDPIYRFAYAMSGSAETAGDCTTTTFLRAMKAARRFDGRAPLRNWLLKIASREVMSQGRKKRWFSIREEDAQVPDAYSSIDIHEAVGRAMLLLSSEQRAAFVLTHVEELSTAEAAEVLGVPIGTVKSRASGARERLRKELVGFEN